MINFDDCRDHPACQRTVAPVGEPAADEREIAIRGRFRGRVIGDLEIMGGIDRIRRHRASAYPGDRVLDVELEIRCW